MSALDVKSVFRPDLGPMQKFEDNAGCGRDGMVDIPDLKSVGRMPVWVRVPPPAPKPSISVCGSKAIVEASGVSNNKKMIGIEVFAGAGGLSHGAEAAGVHVRAAIESNKAACSTFSENHPHTYVINCCTCRKIRNRSGPKKAQTLYEKDISN